LECGRPQADRAVGPAAGGASLPQSGGSLLEDPDREARRGAACKRLRTAAPVAHSPRRTCALGYIGIYLDRPAAIAGRGSRPKGGRQRPAKGSV